MRPLQFKVFDKKHNEFVADGEVMDLIYSAGCNSFMFDNDNYDIPKHARFLEFSGLQSFDNEDIYEGMVVSVPYIDPSGKLHQSEEDFKAIVVFKNGRFELERKEIDNHSLSDFIRTETGKYVPNYGNITIYSKQTNLKIVGWWFDFPELLS